MKSKRLQYVVLSLLLVGVGINLCFGHACHDPWRPTPADPGSVGTTPPPPPPPPPSPPPPTPPTPQPQPQQPPPTPPTPQPTPQPPSPQTLPPSTLPTAVDQGKINTKSQTTGSSVVSLPATQSVVSPTQQSMSMEKIFVIPESDKIKIVGKKGEFRTYIENRGNRDLFDVKLVADSEAFDIKVEPVSMLRLVPGERTHFTIKLALKENYSSGKYGLNFKVSSRGKEIYSGSVGDAGSSAQQPSNILISSDKQVNKILKEGEFKIFVQNNSAKTMENVKIKAQSDYFNIIGVEPANIEKIGPLGKIEVLVKLALKKNVSIGSHFVRIEAIPKDSSLAPNSADVVVHASPE